jgi:hypothetical protein
VTDEFTQAAVQPGRKAAMTASNLSYDKLDRAMAAQAKEWEELLEKVLSGASAEGRKDKDEAQRTIRRAPRASKPE